MRLTDIELSRFKGFEHAQISIAPLTVLIGANNAGKSTILQALALVEQSARTGGLVTRGRTVDLGADASELVNGRSRAQPWRIALTFSEMLGCRSGVGGPPRGSARFSCSPAPLPHQVATEFDVRTSADSNGTFRFHGAWPGPLLLEVGIETEHGHAGTTWKHPYLQADPWHASIDPLVGPVSELPAEVANAQRAANPLAARVLEELPGALTAFRFVGPDRFVERSVYQLGDVQWENPRAASEVVDTLAYDSDVRGRVSAALKRIFGYSLDTRLLPGKQVQLVAERADRGNGRPVNVVNVGSGFIQMIWIILQVELVRRAAGAGESGVTTTIGLEEPELHLHPRAQDDVAQILVEYATTGSQIICTTQSEHLLTAILQRVLDGTLSQADLAVYYIKEGQATRLEVDDKGRLSQGLRGFFEANEDQLQRHIELLLKNA